MQRNILFDLDQTLLDFHASEYIALRIVLMKNGLSFTDGLYVMVWSYYFQRNDILLEKIV